MNIGSPNGESSILLGSFFFQMTSTTLRTNSFGLDLSRFTSRAHSSTNTNSNGTIDTLYEAEMQGFHLAYLKLGIDVLLTGKKSKRKVVLGFEPRSPVMF